MAAGRVDAWRKGAEAGSPAGMVLYGDCLLFGMGLAKDERAARGWYEKAARAGSPGAMNQLGYMYSEGLGGLAKNNAEALRWYQ